MSTEMLVALGLVGGAAGSFVLVVGGLAWDRFVEECEREEAMRCPAAHDSEEEK